jgi:hypothetical protein
MSKIKLTNQEIEKLAYLAVKKTDMDEDLDVKCKKLAAEYTQAKRYLGKLNGEKIEKEEKIEQEIIGE